MVLLFIRSNAQSFNTTISIKKSDCDTLNGGARVFTDVIAGSYTYRWSNGVTIDSIKNCVPGVYFVTVSHYDVLGNFIDSLIDTATIGFSRVSIAIFSITNPTCGANNGTILSSITGGSGSYTFYTIRSGVNYPAGVNLPAGLFQVVAFDNLTGCNSDSIAVVLRDTGGYFALADTVVVPVTCFGDSNGSISIVLTGGKRPYRFVWAASTDVDSFRSNLAQGVYNVSITDSLCPTISRIFRFEVKGPNDTFKIVGDYTNDTCYRKVGSIHLTSTGGNPGTTYFWTDGTSFSGDKDSLVAGLYQLFAFDGNGCGDSIEFNLGNVGGPSAMLTLLDSTCLGLSNGAIRVKVTSRDRPNHYHWSHDATLDTNFIANLAAGVYTLSISNVLECDTIMTIYVGNYTVPSLMLIGDTAILQGQSTTLNGIIEQDQIDSTYWLPKYNIVELSTDASVYPLHSTMYHLVVRLENGCFLGDSAYVKVDSIPVDVRIPNIFTPNLDGINDFFKIGVSESVRNIELHIYDRWGNNIFDSYDKNTYWDGIDKNTNKMCETGVYTYFLYVDTYTNQDRIIKEGNISLIR